MITRSKQDWTSGSTVKVGFLTLTVIAVVATPGDFKPDAYVLAGRTTMYSFVPHHGLQKIDAAEAKRMIAGGRLIAEQRTAAELEKSSKQAAHVAGVAALLQAEVCA